MYQRTFRGPNVQNVLANHLNRPVSLPTQEYKWYQQIVEDNLANCFEAKYLTLTVSLPTHLSEPYLTFCVRGGKFRTHSQGFPVYRKKYPSKLKYYVRKKKISFPDGDNCPINLPLSLLTVSNPKFINFPKLQTG